MRSLRAAADMRTGMEISPKVRWPFQTVVAMGVCLREAALERARAFKGSAGKGRKQEKRMVEAAKGEMEGTRTRSIIFPPTNPFPAGTCKLACGRQRERAAPPRFRPPGEEKRTVNRDTAR